MKTIKYLSILTLIFFLEGCKWFCKDCDPPTPPSPQGIVVTVKDETTSKPIANANVKWVRADKEGSGPTSTDGIFRQEGLDIGSYTVIVTATGYKSEAAGKKMTVATGTMASETFELELAPPLEVNNSSSITLSNTDNSGSVIFKNKNAQYPINLSIEIPQNDQWVKITPTTLAIPAGSQKDVLVTVDAKGRGFGTYNSTVILNYSQNGANYTDNLFVNMIIANPSAPSVTTNSINGITQTSADITGTLSNLGGSNVTLRGICWSEGPNPDPKIDPKVTIAGGGIGTFTLTANNLKEGKTYWVRAYAENANGVGLGEAIQFTTSVTPTPPTVILNPIASITQVSAILSGKISNNGGTAITEQGFCWSTTSNPKYTDNKTLANTDANGAFSANMTGLTQGVVYYVRAFAINSLGANKVGYSNEITFKTQVPTTPAKLSTAAPTNITETSARLQGNVIELGSSPIKEHGFVWSRQNATPEIGNSEKNQMGSKPETGSFAPFTLSNLKKGTLYYFRAYATNNDGQTSYGNVQILVTKEQGLVLYFPFNGDASDVSGNGNNAIVTAKLTEDKFGNSQSAYDLSTGIVQLQNETIGRFVGDFSYSFRVKINAAAFKGSKKTLISKGPYNECFGSVDWSGFSLQTDPNTSSLNLFLVGFDGKQSDSRLIGANEIADLWHHIVFIKNGNIVKVYLDGLFFNQITVNTSTYGFDKSYSNQTTREGKLTISGFSKIDCTNVPEKIIANIDDFRLYSYGLSETEVEELSKR